ncbi:sensor histidine kinase [Flavobacterium sp.]|uniref:sensor histidine kinase n=1 Tax=Flavobacterium sp. TaxID=239 RepID=UPI002B4B6794|nr:triple tyrosine motif-containing protein [Flavobacterium sp.]HLP64824.1 triple tyrosine motif-containing protein [Flavobacterium sp.]
MKHLKNTYLFFAFVFFQLFSIAQNSIPPLTYLTTEKGLSQAISYDIFQDSRGIMWFTSYDGINKFDSNKITKFTYDYNDKSSFLGNLSIGIVEDANGNIWTGGNSCLNIYRYHQNKFKHVKVDDKSNFYHYPLFATKNSVVFQKGNRFYITDITSYKSKLFFVDKAFKYTNFSSKTFETSSSYIVFIKGKPNDGKVDSKITFRVYEFSKSDLSKPKITHNNTAFDTKAFQKINENTYLIGTNSGLSLIDLKTKKISSYLSEQFKNDVTAIDDINASQFLLSTKNGEIYKLDVQKNTIFLQSFFSEEDQNECKKNGIQRLFVDQQENVFFTLWGKGIACYDQNNSLFKYSFTKSDVTNKIINDQYICSLLPLKNNDVLVYTKSGDFYTVNQEGKNITKIANINSFNRTNFGGDLYLHNGFDGRIFVSGLDKLYELRIKEKQIVEVKINCPGLQNNTFNDITIFDENHYIIAAQKGIHVVSKDFKTSTNFSVFDKNETYLRCYIVNNKYLYVCRPYKGFDLYNYENNRLKKMKSFLINASIKDMYCKDRDQVWFASTLGILKHTISSNKVVLDNSKDKWTNSYLYCLLPDNNGNLWVSHNAGITKFDIDKDKTTHYNLSNGLQGYEFNTKAFAKNNQGVLFFGGTNGLNIINPNENYTSKNKDIILFDELKIEDKITEESLHFSSKKALVLKNNQTTFSLKPIIINYNSSLIQHDLLYKLDGIDKTWISGQSNQIIRYSNLPAGNYTFYVKTPDNNQLKSIEIVVHQVFWKSIWFWMLVFGFLAFTIWFTQRGYYLAQVNQQEAEIKKLKAVELERERIAHDMHDDLGSGLTAIAYLSQKQDSNSKIQEKAKELIKNMSELIWSMKSENDSIIELISYLKRYANTYCEENDLEINFTTKIVDEKLQIRGDIRKNIYLIVKEALHNVVKHSGAKKVEFIFQSTKNIELIIHDNGSGINIENTNNGNGLKNIRNRVEKMDGKVDFSNDNGTKIVVFVPIK